VNRRPEAIDVRRDCEGPAIASMASLPGPRAMRSFGCMPGGNEAQIGTEALRNAAISGAKSVAR